MRLLLLFFTWCIIPVLAQNGKVQYIKADSAEIKKMAKEREESTQKMLEDLKNEPASATNALLEKFDFKKGAANTAWYRHTVKPDTNQCWIETPVNKNGYIYLKARYTGTVPYTIYSVNLKIGNQGAKVYGQPQAINSNYIFRRKGGKGYLEVFHSFPYETANQMELRAMNIIEAIAMATEDQNLVVQFMGEADNFEFALSKENIAAIKDSWHLSQRLCYAKGNYTVCHTFHGYRSGSNCSAFLFTKVALTKDDMRGIERY